MTDPIDTIVVGRHVWPDPPTDDGVNLPVLRGLQRRLGGRMVVIAGTSGDRLRAWHGDRLEIVLLPLRGNLGFLRAASRLSQQAAREAPHRAVFVASDVWGGLLGAWIKERTGIPFVMQIQGEILRPGPAYGSRVKRGSLSRAARIAVRRASVVRCLNAEIERGVGEVAPRARTVVLGSRVDTSLFRPGRSPRMGELTDPVITCVARLSHLKNQQLLVQAMSRCLETLPGIRLQLVGSGPDEERIRVMSSQEGIDERVSFCGQIAHRDLPALLRASDIFAFPSRSEGQPRAVLEALAVGIPVVASDIPAHRGVVIDGETGIVLPPDDADAWARAFIALAAKPELRSRLAKAGSELVQDHHAFEPQLDLFADLIRSTAPTL